MKAFQKILLIFFLLMLSACSTHRTSTSYPTQNFKILKPHYVPVQQGKIEFYQFGTGSPIVLIPGYATDISSWNRYFLAKLAEQHRVIVLNNRKVGGSQIQSEKYDTQDLANDTFQLIQQLHLKNPAILGISMGGMIAQQLAVLHSKNLSQLILINTAIAGQQAIHPKPEVEHGLLNFSNNKLNLYVRAVKLFFPPEWRARMAYALVTERFLPQNFQSVDLNIVMKYQKNLVLNWIKDDDAAKKIKKIALPVLILNGKADTVIPPENSIILANNFSHSTLKRWKDGGHAMIYQYPIELAEAINIFLQNPR